MNGIFFKRFQISLLLQDTAFIKSMFLLEGTACRVVQCVEYNVFGEVGRNEVRDDAAEISDDCIEKGQISFVR